MHCRKTLGLFLNSQSYLARCRISFQQNRSNSSIIIGREDEKASDIVGSQSAAVDTQFSDIVGSQPLITNKDDTKELLDILSAPSSGPSSTLLELREKIFGTTDSKDIVVPQNEDDAELVAHDILKSVDFKPIREYTYYEELLNPTVWFQRLIEFSHEKGGLGVGAAIFGCSLLIKLASVPLHLKAERYYTTLHNTLKETAVLQRNFKAARWNEDKDGQKVASRAFINFKRENGVAPQLTFLKMSFLNLGILGVQLYSINNMAETNMLNMMSQKFAWITHLGAPDPTHALPLISALCFFGFFMDKTIRGYKVKVPHDKLYFNGMILVNIGCTFTLYHACSSLPAVTTLCLATNMLMSRLISTLLKLNYVRNLLGLPVLAVHSKTHIKTLEGGYILPQTQADYDRSVKKVEALLAGQKNAPVLQAEREQKRQYYANRLQATRQRLAELRANLTNPSRAMDEYQSRLRASANQLTNEFKKSSAATNQNRAADAATTNQNRAEATSSTNQNRAEATATTNQNRAAEEVELRSKSQPPHKKQEAVNK